MQPRFTAKIGIILLAAGSLLAQSASKSKSAGAKPAAKSPAASSALPSRATLDSFMKHMFSYQKDFGYEVKDIKQLPGTNIADVSVTLKFPGKSPDDSHLVVLADRKHAIAGNVLPFDSPGNKMANGLPTQEAVTQFVHKYLLPNNSIPIQSDIRKSDTLPGIAEVTVVAGQNSGKIYVTTDGNWAFTGEVIPFGADPFAATRAALAKGNGISKGPANAPVTIVEFSDLECPACKAAQPIVDQVLAQEPDVHFVFQNFPLEQIHPWSFRAAQYADCIGRANNAAFWKFVEATYADQPNINKDNVDQKLLDIAGSSGADKNAVKQCVDQPSTKANIWASQQLGKQVEVQGTPTVFINGRKVANVRAGAESMKMLVDAEKSKAAEGSKPAAKPAASKTTKKPATTKK
jgi:protein-disulfide isomerase